MCFQSLTQIGPILGQVHLIGSGYVYVIFFTGAFKKSPMNLWVHLRFFETFVQARHLHSFSARISRIQIVFYPTAFWSTLTPGGRIFETESAINLEDLLSRYIFESK
ncbi:hypothetical protein GFER_08490 [Geoalkalibacter ferrihydriticus DSM 17813]|uniref:Uncharacterized protein n=1 Tax=Geoalkalibacter ferrihydriticus DSM 17813 TaxID=1121915 RepID=A0A0C2DUE1_9BACT|nr:hypothetical protein GFER_08490 [Geoalkalibacter ferrihydriticus DSM 17813]